MLRLVLPALAALLLAFACDNAAPDQAPSRTPQPTTAPSPTPDAGAVDSRPGSTDPLTVRPNPDPPVEAITQVATRIGLHPEAGGWDRIVFEFDRGLPQADISYVESVFSCGPGELVPVQGGAILAVRMLAQAHNDQGMSTIPARQLSGQGGVIVEAKMYCDFEGHLDWAIGLKAKKPFKVTTLSNPTRLVIDIKQ